MAKLRSLPLRTSEQFIAHNLIVAAGTISAGVLGVGFQVVISHRLPAAEYGGVFAVLTLLSVMWLPAAAITLLMAREASRDDALGRLEKSVALLRGGDRLLILTGTAASIVFALASPFLGGLIDVPVLLMLAAALGIPFGFALPLLLGVFQGEQRFLAFSIFAVGQAGLKLLAALALGAIFGAFGVILGISVATAAVYLIARESLRARFRLTSTEPWLASSIAYLALVLPSTMAIAVLLNVDVLLVKHFFTGARAAQAGQYAAVVAIGRAIFWGASAVATVLFPKVVFRDSGGKTGSRLVFFSLAVAAAGGLLGLSVLARWSALILAAFAGPSYAAGANYLPSYAVAMTLFGCAVVLVATHQSLGRSAFLWILLPVTVAEPVLIIGFHRSLIEVVQVVVGCMAALAVGLAALSVWQKHLHRRSHVIRLLDGGPFGGSAAPVEALGAFEVGSEP